MRGLWAYLTDERARPRTSSCRVKAWAHDHAFTFVWITLVNAVCTLITVIQCH